MMVMTTTTTSMMVTGTMMMKTRTDTDGANKAVNGHGNI